MNVHTFFGIIIMIYIVFLIFASILNVSYKKHVFLIMNILFILIFVILAYTFNPPHHFDLYYYFSRMSDMQNKSWGYSSIYGPYSETPTINFLMHLISQTGNFNLLSPISILIIFGNIVFVSYRYFFKYIKKNISSYNLYLYLVISVLGISLLLSGIRQNLAWSFMLLAVHYDFFEKKQNKFIKILLYIFPLTIHVSAVTIPIIRLSTNFFIKNRLFSILILLWPLGINFLVNYYSALPPIIQTALSKLEIYTNLDSDLTSMFVSFQLYIVLIVLTIYLSSKNKKSQNKFAVFYISILFFGLSAITITTLRTRILDFAILISLPVIARVYSLRPNTALLITIILIASGGLILTHKDIYPFLLGLR